MSNQNLEVQALQKIRRGLWCFDLMPVLIFILLLSFIIGAAVFAGSSAKVDSFGRRHYEYPSEPQPAPIELILGLITIFIINYGDRKCCPNRLRLL